MGCPNKSNPYHHCNSYCAERYGEPIKEAKEHSESIFGFFKKKKDRDSTSSTSSSSSQTKSRFTIEECPNVSNPYHECSDYCISRYTKREISSPPPPQNQKPSELPTTTLFFVDGCPNRTNPYHTCSDYCKQLVKQPRSPQPVQQSQQSTSNESSTIQELLMVIDDLQKSKQKLTSENESLKRELEKQRKEVKEQKQNGKDANLDGLSASQLKQMIKEQKDYLTKLKKKLEQVEELQEDLSKCIVCLTNNKEMIMVPCGHKVLCPDCAGRSKWSECPICKAPVTTILKVFE